MSWWLAFTPFIAAAMGWMLVAAALQLLFHPAQPRKIAGWSFQGLFPKKQMVLAAAIGRLSASLIPVKELEQKITHPDNVKKIMPQAEEHIDNFLRVKLVKSMPVVGMFVGDKTINNLKALFVAELEQLFPEIMSNYMGRLQEDFDIESMVTAKIAAVDPAVIEATMYSVLKKELRQIKQLGALLGFVIGVLQLLVLLLLHR